MQHLAALSNFFLSTQQTLISLSECPADFSEQFTVPDHCFLSISIILLFLLPAFAQIQVLLIKRDSKLIQNMFLNRSQKCPIYWILSGLFVLKSALESVFKKLHQTRDKNSQSAKKKKKIVLSLCLEIAPSFPECVEMLGEEKNSNDWLFIYCCYKTKLGHEMCKRVVFKS